MFSYLLVVFVIINIGAECKCSCDSSDDFIRLSDSLCFKNVVDGYLPLPAKVMFGEEFDINSKILNVKDLNGNSYFRLKEEEEGIYETFEPLTVGGVLILSDDISILFDTGIGEVDPFINFGESNDISLYKDLVDIGCTDIDVIVTSHLHFDHTGWNIHYVEKQENEEKEEKKLVEATWNHPSIYFVQNDEYYYWKQYILSETDDFSINATKQTMVTHIESLIENGLIALRFGNYYITSNVQIKRCIGHTPGHQCVYLYDDNKDAKVMLIGDAVHSPYQICEPNQNSVWDSDIKQAAKTRLNLINEAFEENLLFAPIHYPGIGKIQKCHTCNSQSGFIWVPFNKNQLKQWSEDIIQHNGPKTEI